MKPDNAVVELINRSIDGTLLPAEVAHLKELLRDDQNVRELYEELSAATGMLDSVKEVAPPAGLTLNVMRAIESTEARERSYRKPFLAGFVAKIRETVMIQYVYTFSAGLVVGAMILLFFVQGPEASSVDRSGVSGTLILTGQKVDVNVDRVNGTITTGRSDGVQSIDLRLVSSEEVSARIVFDPKAVRIEAVKRLEDRASSLSVQGGEIDIQGSGRIGYRVSLSAAHPPAPEILLSLFSAGRLVYQKEMALD